MNSKIVFFIQTPILPRWGIQMVSSGSFLCVQFPSSSFLLFYPEISKVHVEESRVNVKIALALIFSSGLLE